MHAFDNLKAAMKAAGHILEEGEGIVLADYHQVKSFLSNIGLGHIGTDFHRFDDELAKLENGGHTLVNVGTQAGEEFVDHSKSLFQRSIAGIEKFVEKIETEVKALVQEVEDVIAPPAPAVDPETPHMEGQPPVNPTSAVEETASVPAPEQSPVQEEPTQEEVDAVSDATDDSEETSAPAPAPADKTGE